MNAVNIKEGHEVVEEKKKKGMKGRKKDPNSLKARIIRAYKPGMNQVEMAKKFGCSPQYIWRCLKGVEVRGNPRRGEIIRERNRKKEEERVEEARVEREEILENDPMMLRLIETNRRWRRDMALFVEEALGINGRDSKYFITVQQRQACDEVSKLVKAKEVVNLYPELGEPTEEDREYAKKIGISIMSGQGPGKDAWTSWFVIWFLICFPNVLIPCTAPGADQLKNILWAEVGRWLNRRDDEGRLLVIPYVRENLILQADKIFVKEFGGKRNFAFPKTANPKDDPEAQANTLYGYHDDYMAVIIDEASGVLDPVFKPLEGTITGMCNFIVLVFNPIRNGGFAVESHTGTSSHKWIQLQWNSEDSEIVTKQHIEDMEEKFGRNSNTFRTLVLGLPPLAEPDTLIPHEWVQEAALRTIDPMDDDPHIGFVDPGGGGDNSVYSHRQGLHFYPLKRFSSPDTMVVVQWACKMYDDDELDVMGIDNIGIGAGVYYRMKQLGYRVRMVDARRTARDRDRFDNVRIEMWWTGREVFESGAIDIPDEQFLKEELWSPKFEREGKKIKVESKTKMKKRLGSNRSPNDADSVLGNLYIDDRMYRKVDHDIGDDRVQSKSWMKRSEQTQNNWLGA